MNRRLAAGFAALCLLLLNACRLDVVVDVKMSNDGSGVVSVTATADAELSTSVPDLKSSLVFDDARANGWEVGEITEAADGSLSVVLSHTFANNAELANVLNSIGPPLESVGVARTSDGSQITNAIDGTLILRNGYGSFADSDLITAAGGVPFATQIDASGVGPATAIDFTLQVEMPGRLVTAAAGTELEDTGNGSSTIRWTAPLDGTSTQLRYETVQKVGSDSNWWATPLSWVSLILLIAWAVFSVVFILFVAYKRRQRSRNRQHAVRHLSSTRSRR